MVLVLFITLNGCKLGLLTRREWEKEELKFYVDSLWEASEEDWKDEEAVGFSGKHGVISSLEFWEQQKSCSMVVSGAI